MQWLRGYWDNFHLHCTSHVLSFTAIDLPSEIGAHEGIKQYQPAPLFNKTYMKVTKI